MPIIMADTHRVVTVVDAKFGADYTYIFNNAANSNLTLEAGWIFSNYFNAIDRLQTKITVAPPIYSFIAPSTQPGISSAIMTGKKTSNFAIQGPYMSLVLHV